MKSKDSLSVYNRKESKPSQQERINLERTAELHPENKPLFSMASNVPYKGNWNNGRIL